MRLYLLPPSFHGQPSLAVSGKDAQYLTRVLRLKQGQRLTGRDADGALWHLTIQEIGRDRCVLHCEPAEHMEATTDALPDYGGPLPRIVLFQCLCKGKKLEQIVRQATEIGACRIVPVQSKHCVVDIFAKRQDAVEDRTARLEAMVKEAVQQSGSRIPTKVEPPIAFSDIPSYWGNRGLGLFFHQSIVEGQLALTETVAAYRREHGQEAPVAVVIGPEGGLAPEETTLLEQAGFKPILLKTNILRAETAAVYALAAVQTIMTEA